MVCTKKASIITMEENGLKVSINYDKVIGIIDEEINNSYIYEEGIKEKNLYFFGKKNIPIKEYIESLIGIKNLINKMFTTTPTINIFDFIPVTKKGTFRKNGTINIASPIAGLFINCDYFKYISYFSLQTSPKNEKEIDIIFSFLQSDVNKFEPIFFEDYTTPIIREKISAIKKANLKPGMIYSDEKHKKFFLFVGYFEGICKNSIHHTTYIKSKTLLPETSFTNEFIMDSINEYRRKTKEWYDKYDIKYTQKVYLYIKLTKKQFEEFKKLGKQEDFETFIMNTLSYSNKLYFNSYENPIRVFNEEIQYLNNIKPLEIIYKRRINFVDNLSGPGYRTDIDRDYYTSCDYSYLKYE